jgi:hypothetical protein
MSKFDDVIDPDSNIDALAEAMNEPVDEEVTILELLNKRRIKVRYQPQSLGASLEFDHGTPMQANVRKPKFDFHKWAKESLPKMNELALKNIQIVNDVGKPDMAVGRGDVRLSLISPGEFRRLQDLCFPGTTDTQDLTDEDGSSTRKSGKGVRRGKSDAPGEEL